MPAAVSSSTRSDGAWYAKRSVGTSANATVASTPIAAVAAVIRAVDLTRR